MRETIIPLGRRLPVVSSSLPESHASRTDSALCLALHQVGFTKPSESPHLLVRSYRTISPLPGRPMAFLRRYFFCGTFPRLTTGGRYPPPRPAVPGLSSHSTIGRTSDRPVLSGDILVYLFLALPGIPPFELCFDGPFDCWLVQAPTGAHKIIRGCVATDSFDHHGRW